MDWAGGRTLLSSPPSALAIDGLCLSRRAFSPLQTIRRFFAAGYRGAPAWPGSQNDGLADALPRAILVLQPGRMRAGSCNQGRAAASEGRVRFHSYWA